MRKPVLLIALVLTLGAALPAAAQVTATNRLCDPGAENCRDTTTPMGLLKLIEAESVGIDVGFWFMEDIRYARAFGPERWQGVAVRLILAEPAVSCCGSGLARAPAATVRSAAHVHFRSNAR